MLEKQNKIELQIETYQNYLKLPLSCCHQEFKTIPKLKIHLQEKDLHFNSFEKWTSTIQTNKKKTLYLDEKDYFW